MIHVFLDTNVVIDLLGNRVLFSHDAEVIATLAEHRKIKLFCSTLTISTVYYVLRREHSETEIRNIIHKFSMLCSFLSLEENQILDSLTSPFSDYEDALQHEIARRNNCDFIVTRNTKDFTKAEVSVLSPSEFITHWNMSN